MEKEAIEAAVTTVASKSTYGGAATSLLGWMVSSQATVLVGLAVAVGGFIVNWYYKREANKRALELHAAMLESARRGKWTAGGQEKGE